MAINFGERAGTDYILVCVIGLRPAQPEFDIARDVVIHHHVRAASFIIVTGNGVGARDVGFESVNARVITFCVEECVAERERNFAS